MTEEAAPAPRDTPRQKSSKKQGDPRQRTPLPEVDYQRLYGALRLKYDRAQHELKLYRLVVSGARLGLPAALEHLGIDPEAVGSEPSFQTPNNPRRDQIK